jgi:hypothetical protein
VLGESEDWRFDGVGVSADCEVGYAVWKWARREGEEVAVVFDRGRGARAVHSFFPFFGRVWLGFGLVGLAWLGLCLGGDVVKGDG